MKICSIDTKSEMGAHRVKVGVATLGFALAAITMVGMVVTTGSVGLQLALPGTFGLASLIGLAITLCKTPSNPQDPRLACGAILRTVTLETEGIDKAHFQAWLVERAEPPKRALLQAAIRHANIPTLPSSHSYQHIIMDRATFDGKLRANLTGDVRAEFKNEWFKYDSHHTYIDFANARIFGGGWRTRGFVQEETMFTEFLKLALLAYLSDKAGYMIHPNNKGNTDPQPFVIDGAQQHCQITDVYGGRALAAIRLTDIPNHVTPLTLPSQPVTITGIAAPYWKRAARYSPRNLQYILKAAYLAFEAEKALHPDDPQVFTGYWGCGAFNNSKKMMIALQLVAARMAGVTVNFCIKTRPGETFPDYSDIVQEMNGYATAEAALQALLAKQDGDADWRPGPPAPEPA